VDFNNFSLQILQIGVVKVELTLEGINVGMEHGAFDMAGLATYLHGMIAGGPPPAATARQG
jgi:hypothetical protein